MKHSVLQLSGSQGRKMDQAGGDSHRIHLPHQGADPFFIPKDIGEIGELAPYIKVRDAQVVPIFMPSGEDVEVSPPPIDLSFIPSIPCVQQEDLPRPVFPVLYFYDRQTGEIITLLSYLAGETLPLKIVSDLHQKQNTYKSSF